MVTLLVKMASNVSSLPSLNLYPPIVFDTPVNLFLSNRLIDRIAAAIFFLRDPESLVRFISLTDFPIDFIVFIKYGDKYMTRRGREKKKSNRAKRDFDFNAMESQPVHKICPDVSVFTGMSFNSARLLNIFRGA